MQDYSMHKIYRFINEVLKGNERKHKRGRKNGNEGLLAKRRRTR